MGIHKIDVARGVFWIEVPEADLRVLCGCPADAVKHLVKRGLILSHEVGGVNCETGPNAILLSDTSLQNGQFANLAEFPVLQMLYRQGLIMPGHPNNTGRKPLLIGSAEQVASQMRYIYRGNYGLVSREEICRTGVSEERAEEMMRLKLGFAFGHIRPTRDFLDTRILGERPVEVIRGVSVRRIQRNRFEFSYLGDAVTVDLNLNPGERYDCPYQLGYHQFVAPYFGVIHSGEGDGWDVNRACMSSIVTYQGSIYLIDAGPNLAESMASLGIGVDQVDGIFHTHAHDDHFAGLTTLMAAGRRIRYFATPLVRASVAKKLAALIGLEEDSFGDYFDVHDLVFDVWNDVEGLEVMPIYSPHPVETNIYVFRALWGDGYRTYAHFADIVSFEVLKSMVADADGAGVLDQRAYERVRASYLQSVDLKKIDIGGGMIHGNAADFRGDVSQRILLAHRAEELTPEEKEIGSSAAFGTVDILVAAESEGIRRQAFDYLAQRLPGVPLHSLRMLLNHPLAQINPGAIVLREGELPTELLLVLSGQVEKIRTRDNLLTYLSAGALIGSSVVYDEHASLCTYRAASFVRVMRIPVGLFAEVTRRCGLLDRMRHSASLSEFLEATNLFSEGLPVAVLGRIADAVSERGFRAGEVITGGDLQVLNILRSGRVARQLGGRVLDTLAEHDFFGEEGALFNVPYLCRFRVLEDASSVQIPGELLTGVPRVRWKLFAGYQQRVARIIHDDDRPEVFTWRDSFSIQVAQMDGHHWRLFEIANSIMESLDGGGDRASFNDAFVALVDYTRYHFAAEEELMDLYRYPEAQRHRNEHGELVSQVLEYQGQLMNGGALPEKSGFRHFFESWMVRHILTEDRKYGVFLNSRGVY